MFIRRSRRSLAGLALAGPALAGLVLSACSGAEDPGPESEQPSAQPSASPLPKCENPDRQVPIDLSLQAAGTGPQRGVLTEKQVSRLVAEAKDAGADVVSTTASWSSMQPQGPGSYDFEAIDLVLERAEQAGLDVRLTLQTMPRWAQDAPRTQNLWRAPRSEAELARWSTYVADVAKYVRGRVSALEIWTDPNASVAWPTGPDPEEFARLLQVSYETVNRVAPGITVVSGGLSGNAVGYLQDLYVAQQQLGRQPIFDQVGVNLTADNRPPSEGPAVSSSNEFGLYDRTFMGYRLMRDVMAKHGDEDVPLYVTRFGYRVNPQIGMTEKVRAEYAAQALHIASCDERIGAFTWYFLHRTPYDDKGWSLLDSLERPTKTLVAIRNWSRGEAATPSEPETSGG